MQHIRTQHIRTPRPPLAPVSKFFFFSPLPSSVSARTHAIQALHVHARMHAHNHPCDQVSFFLLWHSSAHQHLDKFSDELKKSDGLRSDIFRNSQTFSDIPRLAVIFSQSVIQKMLGLISDQQLHRLSVHLSNFQTSSFPSIQTVRTSQLYSVQQFSSHTDHENLSVNISPAVVQQVSISDHQLFSDNIRHLQYSS